MGKENQQGLINQLEGSNKFLKTKVAMLESEIADARKWLLKFSGQPYPDSVVHCAAFAHGCYMEACRQTKIAEDLFIQSRQMARGEIVYNDK